MSEEIIVIADSDSSEESLWVIWASITTDSNTHICGIFQPIKLQILNI